MARVHEQVLILKISKLCKDRDPNSELLVDSEFVINAETVLQELVGDNYIVEVVTDL